MSQPFWPSTEDSLLLVCKWWLNFFIECFRCLRWTKWPITRAVSGRAVLYIIIKLCSWSVWKSCCKYHWKTSRNGYLIWWLCKCLAYNFFLSNWLTRKPPVTAHVDPHPFCFNSQGQYLHHLTRAEGRHLSNQIRNSTIQWRRQGKQQKANIDLKIQLPTYLSIHPILRSLRHSQNVS